jgi:hypothetical protein
MLSREEPADLTCFARSYRILDCDRPNAHNIDSRRWRHSGRHPAITVRPPVPRLTMHMPSLRTPRAICISPNPATTAPARYRTGEYDDSREHGWIKRQPGVQRRKRHGNERRVCESRRRRGRAVDSAGNVYVAHATNNHIPLLTPIAIPSINLHGIVPIYSSVPVIESNSWVSIYGSGLANVSLEQFGTAIFRPSSVASASSTIRAAHIWFMSSTAVWCGFTIIHIIQELARFAPCWFGLLRMSFSVDW